MVESVHVPVTKRVQRLQDLFPEWFSSQILEFLNESAVAHGHQFSISDDGVRWIRAIAQDQEIPRQGWKLHVSANPVTSMSALTAIAPILFEAGCSFKIVRNLSVLVDLNNGFQGLSQIGKFVTVYPSNEGDAVHLGTKLVRATEGLDAPEILSDRRVSPRAPVYYRYGEFITESGQLPGGTQRHGRLVAPDGSAFPDIRDTEFHLPPWASDPFDSIARPPVRLSGQSETPEVLFERFMVLPAPLSVSARGTVHLAVDLIDGVTCVVKRARPSAKADSSGGDAIERLRHEAAVLQALPLTRHVPRYIGLFGTGQATSLVTEYVKGVSLQEQILRNPPPWPAAEVFSLEQELRSAVNHVHEHGYLFRDIQPGNILITDRSNLVLVDFESCVRIGQKPQSGLLPTGYAGPNQYTGSRLERSDDFYSIGAILYYLGTGANPLGAPDPLDLLSREPRLVNPNIAPRLEGHIRSYLSMDVEDRVRDEDAAEMPGERFSSDGVQAITAEGCLACAHATGQQLLAEGVFTSDGQLHWNSRHFAKPPGLRNDLYWGVSGIAWSLADMWDETNESQYLEACGAAARWLSNSLSCHDQLANGLYFGSHGAALTLSRVARITNDSSLLDIALETSKRLRRMEGKDNADLTSGYAGLVRAHTFLHVLTREQAELDYALQAAQRVIDLAEPVSSNSAKWPSLDPDGSTQFYLGYAHGAAGIGDALLDVYQVTGETIFADQAIRAARYIVDNAVVSEGFAGQPPRHDWSNREFGATIYAYWCHGAPGIVRFLLRLVSLGMAPDLVPTVRGAAESCVLLPRTLGPTQCHGLAGGIEALLDVYQHTQISSYLENAQQLAALLQAFATTTPYGVTWTSDVSSVSTPDLMVGSSGILCALLRLARPESRPHTLSLAAIERVRA